MLQLVFRVKELLCSLLSCKPPTLISNPNKDCYFKFGANQYQDERPH